MAYPPKRHYSGSVHKQVKARRIRPGQVPQDYKLTSAAHAANVFGVNPDEDVYAFGDDMEDAFEEGLREYLVQHNEYQLELPLQNQDELELDLQATIRKYNLALERMGEYALKWHWLQEDVKRFSQVEKTFKDLQVFRRLCGGGDPSLEDDAG